jgi:hypothetical protein
MHLSVYIYEIYSIQIVKTKTENKKKTIKHE